MSKFDTSRYARKSGCPPEVDLDRLHLDELPRRAKKEILRHLDGCPECAQKLAERPRGLGAFPELDAGSLSRRIQESMGNQVPAEVERALGGLATTRTGRRLMPAWMLAACAAAVVLVLMAVWVWLPERDRSSETVRIKGGVKLQVHRKQNQGSEKIGSGARLAPGAKLKFEVSLSAPGHLMVVGVEAGGAIYPGYPSDGRKASVLVEAMSEEFLSGAVELDESVGEEWLHLVLCPQSFDIEQIKVSANGQLKLPPGCVYDSFRMLKEKP